MTRLPDGGRAVARISAVEGLRGGAVVTQDVFVWNRGPSPGFAATGTLPKIVRLLRERDERIDPRIFARLGERLESTRRIEDPRSGEREPAVLLSWFHPPAKS